MASVMNNKGRAAARSGLGAVMGSKCLKAVVVGGGSREVSVAYPRELEKLRSRCLTELAGPAPLFKEFGTCIAVEFCAKTGDLPTKNWKGAALVDFPEYENLTGPKVIALQRKKDGCFRCPILCGGRMKRSKRFKYSDEAHKPEYETLASFGSMCLIGDLEAIIALNDVCNRLGLDTISAGCTIAFAMECYEEGLINQNDTGGIKLEWGNITATLDLLYQMAYRKGFGKVLADGVKVAAEQIGSESAKFAIHIGGQEVPMHDPKYSTDLYLTYRFDATPARHTQGSEERHPPGLIPSFDKVTHKGRVEAHKIGSSFFHVVQCAGECAFVYGALPHVQMFIDFLRFVTGIDFDLNGLLNLGERVGTLRHCFNLREGLNPLLYNVPGRV
ncbi:MAG: aldehyde ferredoxin oxidoreductase C-terminal domain-containing protein, partial [candidate division WOR-3 bacterium]